MKKIEIATPIGLIFGIVIVIYGIIAGDGTADMFIDLPSILIVFGGDIAAVIITYPLETLKRIPKFIITAFKEDTLSKIETLSLFTVLSRKARREGLLSLEDSMSEIEDSFLKKGLQMVVDGLEPEVIKDILELEIDQIGERHGEGIGVFKTVGDYGPAFGMIGTLIGLIIMLANLDDPSSIASSMAVALITTLYGTLLANLIALPLSANLKLKSESELDLRNMMLEGILAVQSGVNPRIVEETLVSYLSPKEREELEANSTGQEESENV